MDKINSFIRKDLPNSDRKIFQMFMKNALAYKIGGNMSDNKLGDKELYNKVLLEIFEEIASENFLRFKAILKKREPLYKNQLRAYEKAFEEYIQVGRKYFDETQQLPYFTEIAEIIPDNKWVHMFRDVIYPILTKNKKDHEPSSDIFDQLGVTKDEFIDRVEKKKKGLDVM